MSDSAPCLCKHPRGEHKHTARAGVVASCLHRGCRCRGFELDELAALGTPQPPPEAAAKAPGGGVVMCTSSEVDELGADQPSPSPAPQVLPLPEVLAIWDSLLCQTCGNRFFDEQECCDTALLEVTVIVTRRLNLQLSTSEGETS